MRNVYTFAGLTFALVLAFSLTTAAQTSSTGSKQQSSLVRIMHEAQPGSELGAESG